MKLSLARWEYQGSSAGWWMVRELPGVTISFVADSFGCRWQVTSDPDNFGDEFMEDAWRVWGLDFEFTDLYCLEPRVFPTRSAALLALERAFASPTSSVISEVLS